MANIDARRGFQRLTPDQKNVVFAVVAIITVLIIVLVVFFLNANKASRIAVLKGEAERYRFEMDLIRAELTTPLTLSRRNEFQKRIIELKVKLRDVENELNRLVSEIGKSFELRDTRIAREQERQKRREAYVEEHYPFGDNFSSQIIGEDNDRALYESGKLRPPSDKPLPGWDDTDE